VLDARRQPKTLTLETLFRAKLPQA